MLQRTPAEVTTEPRALFFDAETFFSKTYSLKKLTVPEYIFHPEFEDIIWSVYDPRWKKPRVILPPDMPAFLAGYDPARTMACSFNALFDLSILAWRYDWVPAVLQDPLGMARALFHHKLHRFSLAEVVKELGLGIKGDVILKVQGMHAADIKAKGLWQQYCRYSLDDVMFCYRIYLKLVPQMPLEERRIMDLVLRCTVQPVFYADVPMLTTYLDDLRKIKESLLKKAGCEKAALMSTAKFKTLLEGLGVAVETKKSKRTGGDIPAFAKTDDFMQRLANDDDFQVQALAAARLSQRSTIDETRAQKFLSISTLPWADGHRLLPVPLRYGGAHTHRFCLVGRTQIAILRSSELKSIRLDQLRDDDLVWDGEIFVRHGGLVFAGLKEIIEYDEIVGTPDHRVWTVEHGYRPLAEAKARGCHIARGSVPDPTRIDPFRYWSDSISDQNTVHLQRVQPTDAIQLVELAGPQRDMLQGVSSTQISGNLETIGLGLCSADVSGGTSPLHESEERQLPGLWSARDRVPFFLCSGHDRVGISEPWTTSEREIDRSDQQRRSLRTGQSTLGYSSRIERQQAPTWDIVDCGPHNRFMANGRIVHNSGEWRINLQNLPRDASKSKLRSALIAPPGHLVISADLSQIEARLVAWLAGCPLLLKQFSSGQDPYALLAERIFGYRVTKSSHPVERFIGKTGILGLGYGCGVDRFFAMVLSQARQAGLELGKLFSYVMADHTVEVYRETYWEIPDLWHQLDRWLPTLNYGPERVVFGPRAWREDFHDGQWLMRRYDKINLLVIKRGAIVLPNGMELRYNVPDVKIYGAKLLENIIQALARIVVMQAALRLRERGYRFALQCHDELVFVIPKETLGTAKEIILTELIRQPAWAPGLPLAAEVGHGPSYGEAK